MANQLAPFTPIKFSLKTVELLYNDTLYPFITNTKYEGEIKDSGDKVRVRTAAKITLSNYTKGQTLVKQDLNPTSEDLEIDQLKYFSFGVDDVDKIQNDIDAINEYAMNTKRDMSELIDADILNYGRKNVHGDNAVGTDYSTGTVAVAATTGVVTGTGTTFTAAMVGGFFKATGHTKHYIVTAFTSGTSITIADVGGTAYTGGAIAGGTAYVIKAATAVAVTKSNIYAQIVALRTVLGQRLAPKEGRFLVMNSQAEGVLLQAPEFIPAVQSAYNNVVEKGLIGTIAGFKVYTSELVDGNNTTGYWFLAGTRDFMSFAAQITKTSVVPSEADPNSFVSTCKGLLVYGRKVFEGTRPKGAVLRATLS
jgi:hypothetical protein